MKSEKTFRSVSIRAEFNFQGKAHLKLTDTTALTCNGRIVYVNPNEVVG